MDDNRDKDVKGKEKTYQRKLESAQESMEKASVVFREMEEALELIRKENEHLKNEKENREDVIVPAFTPQVQAAPQHVTPDKELEEEIASLKIENENLQDENADLKNENKELKGEINKLYGENDILKAENDKLKDELNKLKEKGKQNEEAFRKSIRVKNDVIDEKENVIRELQQLLNAAGQKRGGTWIQKLDSEQTMKLGGISLVIIAFLLSFSLFYFDKHCGITNSKGKVSTSVMDCCYEITPNRGLDKGC